MKEAFGTQRHQTLLNTARRAEDGKTNEEKPLPTSPNPQNPQGGLKIFSQKTQIWVIFGRV